MTFELLPDVVLSTLLLIMAWGAIHAPTRYDAMALFVAFGIVVALIWARLGAPDLALAEAAIGAGLTGVLLLQAARHLPADAALVRQRAPWFGSSLLFLVLTTASFAIFVVTDNSLGLATVASSAVLSPAALSPAALSPTVTALPDSVAAAMADSGVGHPVTAVLLNFRAWDTLLELMVLLLALTGVRQLYPRGKEGKDGETGARHSQTRAWPLLQAWTRFLAPVLVLTGGYLLWRGADEPGGAFQAGALLASAAVILRLTGLLPALSWTSTLLRLSVVAGAFLFLMVALTTLFFGEGWLVYPVLWAGGLIIAIELLATVSIAVTLSLLVIGEPAELSP